LQARVGILRPFHPSLRAGAGGNGAGGDDLPYVTPDGVAQAKRISQMLVCTKSLTGEGISVTLHGGGVVATSTV
jgi:hypothetical protein